VTNRVHHSALCVADVDVSLRFYRDGIGLDVLMDQEFDGDWPALFGTTATRLRSVFLGDPGMANAGIVELVAFVADPAAVPPPPVVPQAGFFLLSFFTDMEAALARLRDLGLGGEPRRIAVPGPDGPVAMATVRDPDGVLVELIDVGAAIP
jgi:catechol 2,3-dioxygenase-like lactoylglutathione lyase family enzyme